jgi:hypothetical protein
MGSELGDPQGREPRAGNEDLAKDQTGAGMSGMVCFDPLSLGWLPEYAISKQRKHGVGAYSKIRPEFYRTTCRIRSLRPSLPRESNLFSCNVALGEPK